MLTLRLWSMLHMLSWINKNAEGKSGMKIAVIPNLTRSRAAQTTWEVLKKLKECGADITLSQECSALFGDCNGISFSEPTDAIAHCDVTIAIGGDGTMLHSGKIAANYSKPILGINAGRLAFMAGLESHELSLLDKLFTGKYTVDKRMMLDVLLFDENGCCVKQCSCINDAVFSRKINRTIIELTVENNGRLVNNYRGDGVIFATPTGSTAYSLSAGGPVLDPTIESIILTPVCTHSLFSHPIIFRKDARIRVYATRDDEKELCVSCDGETPITINCGCSAIVQSSQTTADFIRIKSDSFTEILNSKMLLP